MSETKQTEKHSFQAEVKEVLHLMVHSLYSNKEIFVRELISNSSAACDKLRYEALQNESLLAGDSEFNIDIEITFRGVRRHYTEEAHQEKNGCRADKPESSCHSAQPVFQIRACGILSSHIKIPINE